MELDELKTAWSELDRRLEAGRILNLQVLKELKLDKTRSALRGLSVLLSWELVCGVVTCFFTGSFLAVNFDDPWFAIPALVLHAAVLFAVVAAVYQLTSLAQIDYAGSMVAVQARLAKIRKSRVRTTQWLLLSAPLLWTPLAIVSAKGLLGFDIYAEFGLVWVALHLALGVVTIPIVLLLARRYSGAFDKSPFFKRLANDIAGRSLTGAQAHLEDIARFENEE